MTEEFGPLDRVFMETIPMRKENNEEINPQRNKLVSLLNDLSKKKDEKEKWNREYQMGDSSILEWQEVLDGKALNIRELAYVPSPFLTIDKRQILELAKKIAPPVPTAPIHQPFVVFFLERKHPAGDRYAFEIGVKNLETKGQALFIERHALHSPRIESIRQELRVLAGGLSEFFGFPVEYETQTHTEAPKLDKIAGEVSEDQGK